MHCFYVFLRCPWVLLLACSLLTRPVSAGPPASLAVPSLAEALNPDGTLRAGARGSFDARRFRLSTAPDGRPVFRPAGPSGAGNFRWRDGFGRPNGTDGPVWTVVRSGSDLYVGGSFTVVGHVAARHIARWDGTAWSGLGSGLDGEVNALAVTATGELYAGGRFSQAGPVPARNVARWNGSTWSALGSGVASSGATTGAVYTLAIAPSGDLYAGGYFDRADNLTDANNIARWDGTAWNRLGTVAGNGTNGDVKALAVVANGDVYVGGQFTQVGLINANRIAKWSGGAWTALGQGIGSLGSEGVFALALAPNGDLYAGGVFVQAGGRAANALARWNGTTWAPLIAASTTGQGNGVNSYVQALAVAANGDLYVGGLFTQAGLTNTNGLAKWNGTAWSTLGAGLSNGGGEGVYAISLEAGGALYAGGLFDRSGPLPLENLGRWTGTAWTIAPGTAGQGLNEVAQAVAIAPSGDVYVGGAFTHAGGVFANCVAKWNGTAWSALGTGRTAAGSSFNLPAQVYALAVAPNGDLYAGGYFTVIGGTGARNVARWNGSAWLPLGTSGTNGVSGTSGRNVVNALAVAPNGDLYVGGDLVSAGALSVNYIARWSGGAWGSLGTGAANGVSGVVLSLAVAPGGEVYVGGAFTQAGGQPASRVARWSGTAWSPLGPGFSHSVGPTCYVSALALAPNGDLYAGGYFNLAGTAPVNNVARWNGTAWAAVGGGVGGGSTSKVSCLAWAASGDLYAGGMFTQAGSVPAANIARWDGSTWDALGSGLNSLPNQLAVGSTGLLYAGGYFTGTGDGSKVLSYFAIYDPAAPLALLSASLAPPALFPNPAHLVATLRLPAGVPGLVLTMLDVQGRLVRRYPPAAGNEATLDLRGLPAGVYLVRSGAFTQRLLVE